MIFKSQLTKAMTGALAVVLFASGCTKARDASVPETDAETLFSISEFGDLKVEDSKMKVSTDSQARSLSIGESAKATAEKGIVMVAKVEAPPRLQFMFKNLEISGQSNQTYPITLSVDKQHVTAYKIVSDVSGLSILEKQLAQTPQEVSLQKQIQKTNDKAKIKSLMASFKVAQEKKNEALAKGKASLLVPLFKYKVESFGVLERTKNELKEETSTLRLKQTGWVDATHIKISKNSEDGRINVGLDPSAQGESDRTFVTNSLNNKIMSADTLDKEFQVKVNSSPEARLLTLLDVDTMHIFELGTIEKLSLTESQLQQLKSGAKNSNIHYCSDEIKQQLPESDRQECVSILRFDVPVKYVKPELKALDEAGNQDAKVDFKNVRASEQVGLVQIDKDVQPKKIESNNSMDPRTTVRVADIKGKEFFFKRTLQDAPVSTIFPAGMAGQLTIVKFELQENRLVVRQADQLVQFKSGANETDYEELLSIPVKYFKQDKKDSSGADYSMTRLTPATNTDAEYIEVNWTFNTLSTAFSPYATLTTQCFGNVGNSQVSDVQMGLDKGSLNFTIDYSVSLSPDCISTFDTTNSYNGNASYQSSARLKERISFKLNDGSTEKSYAPQIPFKAQNQMGYGVWTIGKMNPTDDGRVGREGQEINYPVIHNFSGGRTIIYTVTGLEPSAPLSEDIRQLFRQTTVDVVNAWDLAYRQAFKGTSLDRTGRYVEVQFAGDPGITATVGDLDKNIIHYENKFNDSHGILGVSQVGFNPRSGVVVADSLIVYAGNLQSYVAGYQQRSRTIEALDATKATILKEAVVALASTKEKAQGSVTADLGEKTRSKMARSDLNLSPNRIRNLNLAEGQMKAVFAQMKSLGVGNFEYETPQIKEAWLNRVLRKLSGNQDLDDVELQGLIAKEMMTSKSFSVSDKDRALLTKMTKKGSLRTQLKSQAKSSPGCLLNGSEAIAHGFGKRSYKEALREILFFDLSHEMGHSQGLTHNFIGSFDKANFANADGSASQRVYSSVMDYFNPAKFKWDGIGTYDVHALRASHLGLLEVSPEYKSYLETNGASAKVLINGKFISIKTIKDSFAKTGWSNFTGQKLKGALKNFKYCTDIDVGYDPTCQRFDHGTSVQEIVDDLIQEYESHYATNYYAWDRNDFGLDSQSRAIGGSMRIMFQMRQFMDELFYKLVMGTQDQAAIQDYAAGVIKSYFFYNQLLHTAESSVGFLDKSRFMAVPYEYQEVDDKGQPTGKALQDIAVVEKRRTQTVALRPDRIDTIGNEYDKIMAMNFLTMKGYPSYKYHSNNVAFSFLDFEKFILGMTPDQSIFVNTLASIMLDKLQPTFISSKAGMMALSGSEKATVTANMRSYAGIVGILNLESTTLHDKDNFATLFKVGSSLGRTPSDRVSLSALGVSENSKTRLSFWAVDNAKVSEKILKEAASKNFFIKKYSELEPFMENLVINQMLDLATQGQKANDVEKSKIQLAAKLTALNKNGEIVSSEMVKSNPNFAIEKQVDALAKFNEDALTVALIMATNQNDSKKTASEFKQQAQLISESLPLFDLTQKALKTGLSKLVIKAGQGDTTKIYSSVSEAVQQIVDGTNLEVSYGIIMRNIEFLNKLTLMTNPEYNR